MDDISFATNIMGGALTAALTAILALVYRNINHHKFRSRCCGTRCIASLDIDSTRPGLGPVAAPPSPESNPA